MAGTGIEGFYTIPEAARALRLTEHAVQHMLTRHRDEFPRRYRRIGRRMARWRILTTSEVARLSDLVLASCKAG